MIKRKLAVLYILSLAVLQITNESNTHAEELPAAPEGTFSIVVIPDTQHYRGHDTKKEPDNPNPITNPTFDAWTDWIAANLQRQRIVFVSHVGDIVDKNNRAQWAVARRCMDKLHGKVPYGISVGNHDMSSGSGNSSLFQEVFSKSRFEMFDWYGGCYTNPTGNQNVSGNNANSVQLFEGAGIKFVAIHLECNAPDDVLVWADSVFQKYADRKVIVTTHMDLGPLNRPKKSLDYFDAPKGRMTWKKCHGNRGNTSQQMWDKCFSKHKNLFIICCGDQSRSQALRQIGIGKQGNKVHELLSDYGVNGLRVMRFIPAENRIEVRTWNPIKNILCKKTSLIPDRNQHQFTLQWNSK